MKLKRIGLDTSKAVFTLHGVNADEEIILRRDVRRADWNLSSRGCLLRWWLWRPVAARTIGGVG